MKKSNQGFTLIELIIVIVILGILAVTAAPKFLNLTGDARASTVQALEGSIKGAANIVYSKAIIAARTTGSSTLDIENNTVNNNAASQVDDISIVNGYPAVVSTGLERALDLEAGEYTAVLNNSTASSATAIRFYPRGVTAGAAGSAFTGGANCYVSYTQATSAAAGPTITSVTTNCS